MRIRRAIISTSAAAALLMTITAAAATIDRITPVSFSRSVAIPGTVLAAGEYVFEELQPSDSTGLVRVLSADRSHVYLTQFAQSIERPAAEADETRITFSEPVANETPRILSWFRSGSTRGYQFVYGEQ